MLAAGSSAEVLTELGVVLLVLAVVGRAASRLGVPSIPLYLLAGLAMGRGGVIALDASAEFIRVGADVGVVMLLLLLGLEYSADELHAGLRGNWRGGVVDLLANAMPGFAAGMLLGWDVTAAVVLAGVTYISSSGIIAKLLGDLDRVANRETSVVLSVLVIEDLAMAVFLPVLGVLLVGSGAVEGSITIAVALLVVTVALAASLRFGTHLSRVVNSQSSENLLLSILGLTLLAGGLAERVEVSAAVGAFLIGVAFSGRVAETGREVLTPVRDVFGGLFFVFFGLQIDPARLVTDLVPALALAVVTAATKFGTGWWAAARAGIGRRGRVRAGTSLIPRGEFSIVIGGLGVAAGIDDDIGPLTAAYVLVLAVAGSLLMRFADDLPLPPRRPAEERTRRPPSSRTRRSGRTLDGEVR